LRQTRFCAAWSNAPRRVCYGCVPQLATCATPSPEILVTPEPSAFNEQGWTVVSIKDDWATVFS
jgi:hypothetical protein